MDKQDANWIYIQLDWYINSSIIVGKKKIIRKINK